MWSDAHRSMKWPLKIKMSLLKYLSYVRVKLVFNFEFSHLCVPWEYNDAILSPWPILFSQPIVTCICSPNIGNNGFEFKSCFLLLNFLVRRIIGWNVCTRTLPSTQHQDIQDVACVTAISMIKIDTFLFEMAKIRK